MSQYTVVERKQAFLRQQKQILGKGIAPSNKLLRMAEQAGIQPKVLGDIMLKVNRDVKRHGREVYSRQMTDHVVEQIDLLYWEFGAPAVDADPEIGNEAVIEDNNTLYQGDDLTLDKHISKLQTTWDTSGDPQSTQVQEEVDQDSYTDSVVRLQDLSAQRLTLQQKLTTYRTLVSLLEPYRKPQENIQPNLIGRDAPLGPELAKTRTLAIRVAGRVGGKYGDVQVPATVEASDAEMAGDDGNSKLEKILDSW